MRGITGKVLSNLCEYVRITNGRVRDGTKIEELPGIRVWGETLINDLLYVPKKEH